MNDDIQLKNWNLFGYEVRPDYTMYIYPAHVWATNRILHTMISRELIQHNQQKNKGMVTSMFRDLRHIQRMHGISALYNGFTAYTINHLLNNTEFFGDPDQEFADPKG